MTIEEAQQLVEVWNAKHPVERCTCGNEGDGSPVRATAATPASPGTSPPRRRHPSRLRLPHRHGSPPDPQAAAVLGRRFWELLAEANRQQVDLTVALTETLARLSTPQADDNRGAGHPRTYPRTFRTRLFLRPLRPRKLRRRATPAARTRPGMRPLRTPQGNAKSTTTDYDTPTRHVDTTSRYDETGTSDNSFSNTSDRLPISRWASRSSAPEGVWLLGPNGKKWIDLISGVSVSNVGHNSPTVVEAVCSQARDYLHLMVYGEVIQSPQVRYAARIAETAAAPTAIGLLRQFGQRSGRRGAQAGQTLHGPHRTGLV
ncbi:MAG: aminotransferase class III-fold pyridoxal phosphate-dependent enzyme [Alistipes indistinctus]